MDEGLYNDVLAALEAAHGDTTSDQDRTRAFNILEGFKDRPDTMEYALYFLTTPSPRHTDQQVRHFALHCLEHIMAKRWKPQAPRKENGQVSRRGGGGGGAGGQSGEELSEAQQERLKVAMMEIMAHGTRDMQEEPQYIKVKVADLVAQVAERDFPERWPGFLDQMMQVRAFCGDLI
ncbi:unnamed protein product [Discosporangium mesarthrocarpum]